MPLYVGDPLASWSRWPYRLAVRRPSCSPCLFSGLLAVAVVSSCPPPPLFSSCTDRGFGNGRGQQLVSARRMDDAPYVASWVGSEPAVLVAPVVALVEGRAASHGEGEGGFEGFARVGSWGACCCASGVACSAPLSVVSAFALLIGSLFGVLLCAPLLHFWLVPAEQPLVSEWGAVGRWFCGPSLGAVGGWAAPLPRACLPLCVGYPVLAGRLDRASWLVRCLHCSPCLCSGPWES